MSADPLGGFNPCTLLTEPAKTACQAAHSIASGVTTAVNFASNPLGFLAKASAQATSWVWAKLWAAINATSTVDFTSPGFLHQYAVLFGAATFFTAIVWLLAVVRRAIHGAGLGEAVGKAVGYLWLSVAVCAFLPAVLMLVNAATDSLTQALTVGTGSNAQRFLTAAGANLVGINPVTTTGGGPVVLIVASLLGLVCGAVMWVEMLIRAGALYVGAAIGPFIVSGLVNERLWRHVRRWAGFMGATFAAKPVLVGVLALAAALAGNHRPADAYSSVFVAIALLGLAIFASYLVYRLVPHVGDEMAQVHQARRALAFAGPGAALDGPATHINRGVSAHLRPGGRAGGGTGGGAGVAGPGRAMSAGMVIHTAGRPVGAAAGSASRRIEDQTSNGAGR